MTSVRFCGRVFAAVLMVSAASAPPAIAQTAQATPLPPAASPQEIQQLSAELAHLQQEFDAIRRQYDERLLALEQRLQQIGGGPMATPATPAPTSAPGMAATAAVMTTPAAPVPSESPAPAAALVQAAPAGSSKVFNPDTSVIANFLGDAGKNPMSDERSMQLAEAELGLQAIIDPYSRADFFLSAGPEGLDIEEGYVTFTSLPANLLLKVGKMRAQFGKVNALHTHMMPTTDRPLVTQNLVGGEEGLSDGGMSLSHLIANPLVFLDVTGEVYAGSSTVFQSGRRSKLNYVGRLRAYRDLSESANIDLGASVAFGPTDIGIADHQASSSDPLNKRLFGFDATFRYRPLRRAIYHRLNLRTEMVWSRQEMPRARPDEKAFGIYGLGEYQFAQRWYIGGRVDRSGRALDSSLVDKGGSLFVTFWPSEFSQVRVQYRHTTFAEGPRANEILFQFNFAIGAHGAHVF
jgi:hypothetical protein